MSIGNLVDTMKINVNYQRISGVFT